MVMPEFATNPWAIVGVVVVVLAIIGGVLWWLHKEGKLKLPF
jgi:uncharacterized membrane protein YqiK